MFHLYSWSVYSYGPIFFCLSLHASTILPSFMFVSISCKDKCVNHEENTLRTTYMYLG